MNPLNQDFQVHRQGQPAAQQKGIRAPQGFDRCAGPGKFPRGTLIPHSTLPTSSTTRRTGRQACKQRTKNPIYNSFLHLFRASNAAAPSNTNRADDGSGTVATRKPTMLSPYVVKVFLVTVCLRWIHQFSAINLVGFASVSQIAPEAQGPLGR